MLKISFCTTCKGRLWQLNQTLPANIKILDEHSEIILLDYQSPDGLQEWIFDNFQEYLNNGQLKYFQMHEDYAYTSAYAKNVAHRLGTGDILFNLDADNFIYDGLLYELRLLKDWQLFLPLLGVENEGILGRVGYTREAFYRLNGYNENIVGLKGDDGNLRVRAHHLRYHPIHASYRVAAIQNTREQKDMYVNNGEIKNYHKASPPVNYPAVWGKAEVVDQFGNTIKVG
jgi:glycosyltransferase involved in cell wall biosynthesis